MHQLRQDINEMTPEEVDELIRGLGDGLAFQLGVYLPITALASIALLQPVKGAVVALHGRSGCTAWARTRPTNSRLEAEGASTKRRRRSGRKRQQFHSQHHSV
jgi:hypothetical protein